MSGIPPEYAAQYWADMDRELEAWFEDDEEYQNSMSDVEMEQS